MADKKKSTFWSDFKDFVMRGNVVDMAVGVVVGGAFGKITTSLVNDIIMPPIGMLLGNVNFNELKVVLKEAEGEAEAIAINYGTFIQTIIDFLLVAICIFAVVRILKKTQAKIEEAKKKEEEAAPTEPEAPAEPSEEILLLREIRDSLKK